MPQDRNPFRYKAADSRLLDTPQFITLVIPTFLDEIDFNSLFLPQLSIIRGTPGIGKSTLLRLFDIQTLMALNRSGDKESRNPVYETLSSKGVFENGAIRKFGIYLHCDSSFKDLGAVRGGKVIDLTRTLLDIRICRGFLESLRSMSSNGLISLPSPWNLPVLPIESTPPRLFADRREAEEFIKLCDDLEGEFARLLNSFPDEEIPRSLQPHSRMYSLSFLQEILASNQVLHGLMPIIMMDDFQDLNSTQREMIKNELLRRAPIPRWVAVRNHVLGLEVLINLEEVEEEREYRFLSLDNIYRDSPKKFSVLTSGITRQRLLKTPSLTGMTVDEFQSYLPGVNDTIEPVKATSASMKLMESYRNSYLSIPAGLKQVNAIAQAGQSIPFDDLLEWEVRLIAMARLARRNQLRLFDEDELPYDPIVDGKVFETARLSLSKKLGIPYYFGFDVLTEAASTNIKQYLNISAEFVEWMIERTERRRDKTLVAVEQERKLSEIAEAYFNSVESFGYGSYMKSLVRNLGRLFLQITFLPNAPYAPGVTGFSIPPAELRSLARDSYSDKKIVLKELLRSAVAWNVLEVRSTHQGIKNTEEKQIFYFNRLLCVHFGLPLNYGSWRPLNENSIIIMMTRELEEAEIRDLVKREKPERESENTASKQQIAN